MGVFHVCNTRHPWHAPPPASQAAPPENMPRTNFMCFFTMTNAPPSFSSSHTPAGLHNSYLDKTSRRTDRVRKSCRQHKAPRAPPLPPPPRRSSSKTPRPRPWPPPCATGSRAARTPTPKTITSSSATSTLMTTTTMMMRMMTRMMWTLTRTRMARGCESATCEFVLGRE